jgi:hypothetical protein
VTDPASGNGHRPELPRPGTGRRRSMFILALLVLGLPLAFVIRSATDDGWRQVTSVDVFEERDVIYLPDAHVFVVDEDPPLAFSAASPHLGRGDPVAYCEESETFMEVHGSLWNRLGYYLDGPAPRGLDRIAIRVRNRFIEIKPSIVTEGAPRGAGPELGPTGPFCTFNQPNDGADGFVDVSPLPSPSSA